MDLERLSLDPEEANSLLTAASHLINAADPLEDMSTIDLAENHRFGVPIGVRAAADRLRDGNGAAGLLVSGVKFGDLDQNPTPRSFGDYHGESPSRLANGVMFLIASTVGTPYCFASQQQARLILDVFPLPGHEIDQLGCSSTTLLEWHNEDAFHPLRADFSLLMCVRRGQSAATKLVHAADLRLDDATERELRKPQFAIVPDVSHTYEYNISTSGVSDDSETAFSRIGDLAERLPRVAVLTGDRGSPAICIDFAYMPAELHSQAANDALASLRQALEDCGTAITLDTGDVLVFDNKRCVHGREGFHARYDGTDRWLRRMNIARHRSTIERNRLSGRSLRVA